VHCDGLPGLVLVFPPPILLLPGGGGPLVVEEVTDMSVARGSTCTGAL